MRHNPFSIPFAPFPPLLFLSLVPFLTVALNNFFVIIMSYAAKHICTYEEMINKRKREIVSVVSGAPHPVGCATGGTVRYFPPNSAAIH